MAKKSKTREPRQQRGMTTKRNIIDAAMKLFSSKGYHATNSKEIAREAGTATGCFYAYFSDKKAVFIAALEIYYAEITRVFQNHLADASAVGLDPTQFMEKLIVGILEAHRVFTGFHNELIVMYYSDSQIRKLARDFDRVNILLAREFLGKNRDRLRIANIGEAAALVYRIVHYAIDDVSEMKDAAARRRLLSELIDMVSTYLFNEKDTG